MADLELRRGAAAIAGAGCALIMSAFLSNPVGAVEAPSPMQPGATTGAPAGALPPPGLYFSFDTDYEYGAVKNGSGHNAVLPNGNIIKVPTVTSVMGLVWVPGWNFLGASYGARLVQPFKWQTTKFQGPGGDSSISANGFMNTSITPIVLSWNLGKGFFVSAGATVVLRDGTFSYKYDPLAGRKVRTPDNIANAYWTFEPNFAFTYMNDGWNFTLNNTFDFNWKNTTSNYYSGTVYYLDLTLTKKIDKFTVGVIGNYTKQLESDKINGVTVPAVPGVNSRGNKMEHVMLGPLLAYDIGKATVTLRYLHSLRSRNDPSVSIVHLGVSMPIY